MRKLILKMSVSIDGFVSGKNGESDWIFETIDEGSNNWELDIISRAGAHLMGRCTFNDMRSYWPYSTEPFAAPMNEIPKIAFSRKGFDGPQDTTQGLKASPAAEAKDKELVYKGDSWTNAQKLTGDLSEEINRLKQQPGKDLVAYGGAKFAQSLVKLNLVDEYYLLIHPVALGQGLPVFSALQSQLKLELAETIPFGSGAVAHIYRRVAGK